MNEVNREGLRGILTSKGILLNDVVNHPGENRDPERFVSLDSGFSPLIRSWPGGDGFLILKS